MLVQENPVARSSIRDPHMFSLSLSTRLRVSSLASELKRLAFARRLVAVPVSSLVSSAPGSHHRKDKYITHKYQRQHSR